MNTTADVDQQARACYRAAEAHLSAHTVAELHRRRIAACTATETGRRWFHWPLATAMGGVCALALALGVIWRPAPPSPAPAPIIAVDASETLDVLDALDAINLTALDEDSEFFLWLSTNEASLLAME